jgi:hypothetical protein
MGRNVRGSGQTYLLRLAKCTTWRMNSGRLSGHVLDRQVAEGHCRGEVHTGLITSAHFRTRRRDSANIEAFDRTATMVHHLPIPIGQ